VFVASGKPHACGDAAYPSSPAIPTEPSVWTLPRETPRGV
jgi:hypothetical protein